MRTPTENPIIETEPSGQHKWPKWAAAYSFSTKPCSGLCNNNHISEDRRSVLPTTCEDYMTKAKQGEV